ncbi:aldo/keto reductase [Auraticoccus sp. F435]|uniref:Aldo/keto reductase n=1 Tax=Auraticoccus cholistanensis TaxID=2656650 RepID=A0A6A9UTP0_9ACTN|nr:aldo/keto reductase [Auraticoccus cholistanensis]MVA76193.1 aldo/keto reductase [Auraticoccus cholistanensis]
MAAAAVPTTPVTLGTSSLGGRGDESEAALLADALLRSELGAVDTSNAYAGGHSERHLGAAVVRAGGLPEGKIIYSKADADPDTGDFDAARVLASLEESLRRLALDSLPLYHLHDPQPRPVAEMMAPGGPVETLASLRDQGVVGAIGIAAGPREMVHEYVRTGAFDAVLTHNRYTLADRSARPLMETARELGMTVFNAAPFGGGVLADPSKDTYGYAPIPEELAGWLQQLRGLAADHAVDLAAAALHFSLRDPLVDSTVVGISTRQRLVQLERLLATPVPETFWSDLEQLGEPPASSID